MNFSKIAFIEWEIEDICSLRYNCQGCFAEHPSQDQHMSHGGVLNRTKSLSTSIGRVFHRASKSGSTHEPWGCMEQISWSEQVVKYFDQA